MSCLKLKMERETGLEPANLLLGKQTLYQLSYSRISIALCTGGRIHSSGEAKARGPD